MPSPSDTPSASAPARRGSPRAGPAAELPPFERVVSEHGPAVLRFCASQLGRQRADDCFQETMLAALRAYGSLRDPGAIRTWLFSIAARKAIDAHRAAARAPQPTAEIEAQTVAGDARASTLDDDLWERVRALPAKQRQAVTLRFRADLTHREIGVVMQISEAAARRNVHEGLTRLRKERRR